MLSLSATFLWGPLFFSVLIPSLGLVVGDVCLIPLWQLTQEQTKLGQVFLFLFRFYIYLCVYVVPLHVLEVSFYDSETGYQTRVVWLVREGP